MAYQEFPLDILDVRYSAVMILPGAAHVEVEGDVRMDPDGSHEMTSLRATLGPRLAGTGATVSFHSTGTSAIDFTAGGIAKYGLRLPMSLVGAHLGGDAFVGDLLFERYDADTQQWFPLPCDSSSVDVERTVEVRIDCFRYVTDNQPFPHPFVLDFGGRTSVVGSQQRGAVEAFERAVQRTAFKANPTGNRPVAEQLEIGLREQEWPKVVIADLKQNIHRDQTGPGIATPLSWRELGYRFLVELLTHAVTDVERLPQDVTVTVPTGWSPAQGATYRELVGEALEEIHGTPRRIISVDEATAGGVGVVQEMVIEFGAGAAELILCEEIGEPIGLLTVDIGAGSTDMSLLRIRVERSGGPPEGAVAEGDAEPARYLATTSIEAMTSIPAGGEAYTRLVQLMLIARIAANMSDIQDFDPQVRHDIEALAHGSIHQLDDPFLTGRTTDERLRIHVNERSEAMLEALAKLVPPTVEQHRESYPGTITDSQVVVYEQQFRYLHQFLTRIAERMKVELNSEIDGAYPAAVQADEHLWSQVCAHYLGNPSALQAPVVTQEMQDDLFAPALELTVRTANDLARLAKRRVGYVTITGNGARLRAIATVRDAASANTAEAQPQPQPAQPMPYGGATVSRGGAQMRYPHGNAMAGQPGAMAVPQAEPTVDVFTRHIDRSVIAYHPSRVLVAKNPKLAVMRGAFAITHAAAVGQQWSWAVDERRRLPFDLGVLEAAGTFVPMLRRGEALPATIDLAGESLRQLDLYRRDYDGALPIPLGTLNMVGARDADESSRTVLIDENLAITNEAGEALTAPSGFDHPYAPELPSETSHRW